MKTITTRLSCILILIILTTLPRVLHAQGTAFTYQGRLLTNGAPIYGNFNMTFTLYGYGEGGTPLAPTQTNTFLYSTNGLFTVQLDFGAAPYTSFNLGGFWIEMAVESASDTNYTTLSPRQQITPTPLALTAQNLGAVTFFNSLGNPGSYSSIAGGYSNTVANGSWASIGGGYYNTNSGTASDIGGGFGNTNGGAYATIGGGENNTNAGIASTIGGGSGNYAAYQYTTIAGGQNNVVYSQNGFIGGGGGNTNTGNYAVIGGGFHNFTSGFYATISGGDQNIATNSFATIGGGENNKAPGSTASVGGGYFNTASSGSATVAGGANNTASGGSSTIGGGENNVASGVSATVPGGQNNTASGAYSLAAGINANAAHPSSFVWSDSTSGTFSSSAANQFSVRAAGGIVLAGDVALAGGATTYHNLSIGGGNSTGYLYTSFHELGDYINLGYNWYADDPGNPHIINTGGGTSRISPGYGDIQLATGPASTSASAAAPIVRLDISTTAVTVENAIFNSSSDRHVKQDFTDINPAQILEKVAQLPLTEWSYKFDTAIRHVGPMAQDFYAAFNIGTDDRHIAPIDEGGIALAAIQGLNQKLDEKDAEIRELKANVAELKNQNEKDAEIRELKANVAELKKLVQSLAEKK